MVKNVHETQEKNTEIQKELQPKIRREACHAIVHRVARNQTWLSDWIELNWYKMKPGSYSQMLEDISKVLSATGGTSIKEKISLVPRLFSDCLQLHYLPLYLTITKFEIYLI